MRLNVHTNRSIVYPLWLVPSVSTLVNLDVASLADRIIHRYKYVCNFGDEIAHPRPPCIVCAKLALHALVA